MDLEATLNDLAPRLLRYCLGRTGNRPLAEEGAQEALTALVSRWRRHGPPESPEAFAFTIARRRLQRLVLRQRLIEPLEKVLDFRSSKPDPEERTLTRSDLSRTLHALERIPGKQREALLLVTAGELDVASAAQLLGITPSALKMRVHRARLKLQDLTEKPR